MNNKIWSKNEKNKSFSKYLGNQTQLNLDNFMVEACKIIIRETLEEEVSDFLDRSRYQRRDLEKEEEFRGYRNGYQEYTIRTVGGRIEVRKPRVRQSPEPYESQILDRLDNLEEDLKKLSLEMYVRGLSTRDIEEVFKDKDNKPLLSKSAVSDLTGRLYEEYEEFAKKDLSVYDTVYLFLDGVYESVKRYTNNQAILCAWAILSNGEKVMLGLSAASSESRQSWESFLEDMVDRGLRQPLLIISDGHKGLISAITKIFPESDRQRCIAHKLRNVMSKVPGEYHEELLLAARSIYYAPDYDTAKILAEEFVKKYSDKFPTAVKCIVDDLESCLTHLKYPSAHHRFIRTTNLLERAFEEEKRRTKVFPQHQNEKSAVGLVFSVLIRASEKWRKIKMSSYELTLLKNIRRIKRPNELGNSKLSLGRVA